MANMIKRAWNSKGAGVTAAVVLALVLLVVIVAIVLSFVSPAKPGAQAPQESPAVQSPSAEPTTDNGKCNVPPGDSSLRPKIPADLRWEAAKGLTWPVSASVGPTKAQDGFPACFARSPLGAALFGTTLTYQMWTEDVSPVVNFYAIDSPGKKILQESPSGVAQKVSEQGWTAAGFMVDSFTSDEAQVTVVLSTPTSQTGYTGFPYTVVWKDGDWHLKVLDSGATWAGAPSAPVKGQFVEWRANNG
jgi:hypothetical protein